MNKCMHCKGTGLDETLTDDCSACYGDGESSRSPAGSLPIPEPTSMQRKKVQYLLDKGGKIAQPRLDVVMPDGSVASVNSHGRVYWQRLAQWPRACERSHLMRLVIRRMEQGK